MLRHLSNTHSEALPCDLLVIDKYLEGVLQPVLCYQYIQQSRLSYYQNMPPIPIYSDSPIVAAKPDGVTPQTVDAPTPAQNGPTTVDSNASTYPSARPGAPAMPAPTTSVPKSQPTPTKTITEIRQVNGPPPPQPGAVPTPAAISTASTAQSNNPPSPQPSHTIPQPSQPITTNPPQLSIPPPSSSNLPTRSTIPAISPSSTQYHSLNGPTTLPLGDVPQIPPPQSQYSVHEAGRRSSEQPTGYRQDPYAAEMSAAQRASLEASIAEERRGSLGFLGGVTGAIPGTGGIGTGSGGSAGGLPNTGGDGGVWGSVKALASSAGQKAVELEEEVWRRVNGKK